MSGQVLCCICGVPTMYTPDAMCVNCLKERVDITADIPSRSSVLECRECHRFSRPPWTYCELESAELLSICLKRIPGLTRLKLIDSKFIWTEPHSKRLKVQITVQKEVLRGTNFQQTKEIEFLVETVQCDDCKKTYTPHKWVANVQIRQKIAVPRTLFAFENVVLTHSAHNQVLKVKQKDTGLDFQFGSKSHAAAFVSFAQGYLPVSIKTSKQLISQDDRSNTHNHKYTFSLEVVPISRYDLLFLPSTFAHTLGSTLALCYKVTSQLHLIDPVTARTIDLSADKYWRSAFPAQATYSDLIEFIVLNIEEDQHASTHFPAVVAGEEAGSEASTSATRQSKGEFRPVELEVARARDLGIVDETFFIRSHLGLILKVGDSVLGYDLVSMTLTCTSEELARGRFQDVILVRKVPSSEGRREKKTEGQLEIAGRSGRDEAIAEEVIAAESDP